MKNSVKLSLIILAVISILSGCSRATPVANINNSAVVSNNTEKPIDMENVFKAIVRAGSGLGWSVRKITEGEAEATLYLRSHVAVVSIIYTTTEYSILYKSSTNLKYDAEKHTIHKNYNSWVSNLNRDIQKQLALVGI